MLPDQGIFISGYVYNNNDTLYNGKVKYFFLMLMRIYGSHIRMIQFPTPFHNRYLNLAFNKKPINI